MQIKPVKRWIVCISGYLQNEGQLTGLERIQDRLHRKCNSTDTRVILKSWDDSPKHIAQRIFNRKPEDGSPEVILIGYSYGGWTAVLIAKELQQRGIRVRVMVLCDPVWRPGRYAAPISLLSWWKITIPTNVDSVYGFFQDNSKPAGHKLEVDESTTHYPGPYLIPNVSHRYMDDYLEFRDLCLKLAC